MAKFSSGTRYGVIFDFDGTLAHTLDDIASAVNEVLVQFRFAPLDVDAIRAMIGNGLAVLLQRASGSDDSAIVGAMVDQYRPVYLANMLNATRLYDGVASMLDGLADAEVPMSVLSNKPHEFTAPLCDSLLARWPFVCMEGADDRFAKKPDPARALDICARMGVSPAGCLFVGDSAVDVMTGRNAGMVSIAVTWGYRDRAELTGAEPLRLVDSPAQLAAILVLD
ncbi:MAG: HAD family hydrolase [Planctomycetes bacterium]|nr:HAD family hydrolase [Planctomycetota bacterium]